MRSVVFLTINRGILSHSCGLRLSVKSVNALRKPSAVLNERSFLIKGLLNDLQTILTATLH